VVANINRQRLKFCQEHLGVEHVIDGAEEVLPQVEAICGKELAPAVRPSRPHCRQEFHGLDTELSPWNATAHLPGPRVRREPRETGMGLRSGAAPRPALRTTGPARATPGP
jgi:hypothetical protein